MDDNEYAYHQYTLIFRNCHYIMRGSVIEDLLNNKEFATAIELFNSEAVKIVRFSNKASLLNTIKKRLLDYFKTKSEFKIPPEIIELCKNLIEKGEINVDLKEKESPRKSTGLLLKNLSVNLKHYIGKLIRIFIQAGRDKYQESAKDLLRLLLSNNDLAAKLIEIRPRLGLRLFKHEFENYHDYVDIYFYELIKNNRSILYYEIRNNKNISSDHRYYISEENILLKFIFKDVGVAKRLEVYRGIANFINDYLDDLSKQQNDPYNYSYENFEETRWNSPIFIGIRFFDIMISETMHQRLDWLHPIYCFRIFTEKILRNFKLLEEVWAEHREWNSKYAYLLYAIVSTLEDMIYWIKDSEANSIKKLEEEDCNPEGNVIKACIIYLIKILDLIAENKRVPDKFKRYLSDIVLGLLFELRISEIDEPVRYSRVILNCIKDNMFKFRQLNLSFYKLIKESYNVFDKIHYTCGSGKGGKLAEELDEELETYLNSISTLVQNKF